MYPPLFPNIHYWWYPIGNTPAVDFLREFRRDDETPVQILSLACGDPRNILYTLWCEQGFSKDAPENDVLEITDKAPALQKPVGRMKSQLVTTSLLFLVSGATSTQDRMLTSYASTQRYAVHLAHGLGGYLPLYESYPGH